MAAARAALLGLLSLVSLYWVFSASTGNTTNPSHERGPSDGIVHKRIIAIGDIHGDLPHLAKILRFTRLVDEAGDWSAQGDVLVQTGDIVDRGTDTIALYRYFDALRDQAAQAGGAVHSNLGNHEFMNAMGDWRYVTPEDIATFGGSVQRRRAMSAAGWIGQTWRANYSTATRVPFASGDADAAIVFVHGGITPDYIDSLKVPGGVGQPSVDHINAIGRSFIQILNPTDGSSRAQWNAEQQEFYSERGPVWNRSFATEDDDIACELAERALQKLGARRMVLGHTPHFESMVSRCDGTVLLIDTGISRAYGGVLSALEVLLTLEKVPTTGEGAGNLWTETEVVNAVYEDRIERLAKTTRVVQI